MASCGAIWEKLQSVTFDGLHLEPADVTAEAMKRQCGIAVVLHGKPPRGAERPGEWPMVNTFTDKVVLAKALESMVESLDLQGGYTFVLDDRQVHVMPVADAVKWWDARLKRAPAGAGKAQ